MELATGIKFDGNQWTANAVNLNGEVLNFPIAYLHKRGLPTFSPQSRRAPLVTNFEDWKPVDGQNYLDAYGFKGYQATEINHQFFEVKSDRRTYVVPALALMRGLFKPVKMVLQEMFMPQALDRQCRFAMSDQGMYVLVDAPWATKGLARRHSDWNPLFAWLMTHPSAFDMAGSVHAQSLLGRVGLRIPQATMKIRFQGFESGTTVFVTDVLVCAISPMEKPTIEVLGLTSTVSLPGRNKFSEKPGGFGSLTHGITVARHEDGTVALTDEEWAAIELLLINPLQGRRPHTLPQRELLNGVLFKLHSGQSWKAVHYTAGNWSNAFQALRTWTHRGVLSQILTFLSESRSK